MKFTFSLGALLLTALPGLVRAVDPTDEYRDADEAQSAYLPNHNLSPDVVASSYFGLLWKKSYNANENFYAKPLTFTSSKGLNGNKQVVILVSQNNNIYIEDAKSAGTIPTIVKRYLGTPFTQADAGNCGDIQGNIGIIGTPAIDPNTEYMYFFSKGYRGSTSGLANGAYRAYAIDLNSPTLADVQGFPVLIDGSIADNDPSIYFNGGVQLQRPSVLLRNGNLYGAFGSSCDKFNYTGAIIGVSISSASVITYFSTEVSPWLPTGRLDLTQSSGQGGIWMGGAGISSDSNSRMFFVVGNGKGKQNSQGGTLSGKFPLSTLSESVVNLKIGADGKVALLVASHPIEF